MPDIASAPSTAYRTPDGVAHSQVAAECLALPIRTIRISARRHVCPICRFDTGATSTNTTSHSERFAAALKGAYMGFDFDTGVIWSEATQTDTSAKAHNWRVSNALLNPTAANVAAAVAISPAYAALPAGTVWRIGENAGLNSAAMYNALLSDKDREGYSRLYGGGHQGLERGRPAARRSDRDCRRPGRKA